jgi:hypothetical protein
LLVFVRAPQLNFRKALFKLSDWKNFSETCDKISCRVYVPQGWEAGVRIETHMEGFACRQCGHCCWFLDSHNEITAEDVSLWKRSGRNDILKWVHEIRCDGQPEKYQAWVVPGTQKQTETCPFLSLYFLKRNNNNKVNQ